MENQDNTIDIIIYSKFDYELSNNDTGKIFQVYNQCFYNDQVTKKSQINLAKEWIAKSHIFQWYIAKVGGEVIGIANIVYDNSNADKFAINQEKGENVSSVGVSNKYRRIGVARLLMEKIIQDHQSLKDIVVEIKKANPIFDILVKFYQSLGFEQLDKVDKTDDKKENDLENYYFILRKGKSNNV